MRVEAAPEEAQERAAEDVFELALIQRVYPAQYFPDVIVVQKDVPVKFYITTIQQEHQNKVSVEPFFVTTEPVVPGKTRATLFTPDKTGSFTILNLGHGFTGELFVAETAEQVKEKRGEKGFQEFSLLYGTENIYPQKVVVQKDVPLKLYNIGLREEHSVSFSPFLPTGQTVTPNDVTTFEFVPDRLGTFIIRDETFNRTAELVVEPSALANATPSPADINGDGVVNIFDLVRVASEFGQSGDNLTSDVNADRTVNILDLVFVASQFGQLTAAAPDVE